MKEWSQQFRLIQQNLTKMNQYEIYRLKKGQSYFPFQERTILPKYHLITIANLQLPHSYSFQGIYLFNQHNNRQIFVKLRQPNGAGPAQQRRKEWNAKYVRYDSRIKYNKKSNLYTYLAEQISLFNNQFIVTIEDLYEIEAQMNVCIYYPESCSEYLPVFYNNNKSCSDFKMLFQYQTKGHVTLHHKNKRHARHGEPLKIQESTQNWKYHDTQFILEYQQQGEQGLMNFNDDNVGLRRQYFLDHNTISMLPSLQYDFKHLKKQYKLKLMINQPQDVQLYYLSLLSIPSNISIEQIQSKKLKNILQEDYNNHNPDNIFIQSQCKCQYVITMKTPKHALQKYKITAQQQSNIFVSLSVTAQNVKLDIRQLLNIEIGGISLLLSANNPQSIVNENISMHVYELEFKCVQVFSRGTHIAMITYNHKSYKINDDNQHIVIGKFKFRVIPTEQSKYEVQTIEKLFIQS